jgi:hypothetical protein
MVNPSGQMDIGSAVSYFGPAGILESDEENGRIRVILPHPESGMGSVTSWARMAIPSPPRLRCGDRVLVAGNGNDYFIIGALDCGPVGRTAENRLELSCGVKAEIAGTPDAEVLRIVSGEGGLLFEYDSATGKSRVNAPSGDLEFHSEKGGIVFTSAKSIRMNTSGDAGDCRAAITLNAGRMDLTSAEIGISTGKGDFQIHETRYAGDAFSGNVDTVRLVMNRFESAAATVMQKAKNIYQTVEELAQVHAGRMRTLVDATWHMKSRRTFLKAEEDVKIKGEKIYLG